MESSNFPPSIDPANHTPQITKHYRTVYTAQNTADSKHSESPQMPSGPQISGEPLCLLSKCLQRAWESFGISVFSPHGPHKALSSKAAESQGAQQWGSQAPALIRSHAGIFSAAINSRARLWLGSGSSLGRAGLLKMEWHTQQSVVAGKGD